jgi:hypothetical protein
VVADNSWALCARLGILEAMEIRTGIARAASSPIAAA